MENIQPSRSFHVENMSTDVQFYVLSCVVENSSHDESRAV